MATQVYRERVVIDRPTNNANNVYYTTAQRSSISRVIYGILDVIEILLALRFVLRLLGASAASGFANAIYNITAPLINPFRGIVANATSAGVTIEWTTIIAMAVYAFIAYAIVRLIGASRPSQTTT
jgi:uncharacterized protein YggT (Ycf19 family)